MLLHRWAAPRRGAHVQVGAPRGAGSVWPAAVPAVPTVSAVPAVPVPGCWHILARRRALRGRPRLWRPARGWAGAAGCVWGPGHGVRLPSVERTPLAQPRPGRQGLRRWAGSGYGCAEPALDSDRRADPRQCQHAGAAGAWAKR